MDKLTSGQVNELAGRCHEYQDERRTETTHYTTASFCKTNQSKRIVLRNKCYFLTDTNTSNTIFSYIYGGKAMSNLKNTSL